MTDTDMIAIVTRHGIMRVHRNWMDPIATIVKRWERNRGKGYWMRVNGGWEWIPE